MIEGIIKGQELRIITPTIVSDTINYLTARFRFSDDWNGAEKWAHFEQGSSNFEVKLENDEITADKGLNLTHGKWAVYVHGNRFAGGQVTERITTEVREICVKKTGITDGEPFPDVEASEVERINAELEAVKAGKMEYYILTFDGSAFRHDGAALTFAQIREKCLDTKNFVYAQYENRLYIPAYVSGSNVFFDSAFIQSDVCKMNRISISNSNTVTRVDKVLATNEVYTQIAAVQETVATMRSEVDVLKQDFEQLNSDAVKSVNNEKPDASGNVNVTATVDPSQIQSSVDDYLDRHPVQPLSASGVESDFVPTANGDGSWEWKAQKGGGGGNTAVYIAADHHDFTSVGTDAVADTVLINNIFTSAAGYERILFPKNVTMLMQPQTNGSFAISIPDNTVVDLNGSTWKVNPNFTEIGYRVIGFAGNDSVLMNGTIIGNRDNTTASGIAHSENVQAVWICGKNNRIYRLNIRDTLGDGALLADDLIRSTSFLKLGSTNFESVSYSNGVSTASNYDLTSKELIRLSDYYSGVYNFLPNFNYVTYTNLSENLLGQILVMIHKYDANENYIATVTKFNMNSFTPEELQDAVYIRIGLRFLSECTAFTGNYYFRVVRACVNCAIEECVIDNARRNGVTISESNGAVIENTIIRHTNGRSPQLGIDIEPSDYGTFDAKITNCLLHTNTGGDIHTRSVCGLEISNNNLEKSVGTTGSTCGLYMHHNNCLGVEETRGFIKSFAPLNEITLNNFKAYDNRGRIKVESIFSKNNLYGIAELNATNVSHTAIITENNIISTVRGLTICAAKCKDNNIDAPAMTIGCKEFVNNYAKVFNVVDTSLSKVGSYALIKNNIFEYSNNPISAFRSLKTGTEGEMNLTIADNTLLNLGSATLLTKFNKDLFYDSYTVYGNNVEGSHKIVADGSVSAFTSLNFGWNVGLIDNINTST